MWASRNSLHVSSPTEMIKEPPRGPSLSITRATKPLCLMCSGPPNDRETITMHKNAMVLALTLLLFASVAWAQCPPVSAMSACDLEIVDIDACPSTGSPPTLIWCPGGDMSQLKLRIQANGAAGDACAACSLRIAVGLNGDPIIPGNTLLGCGTNHVGVLIATEITNADGSATLKFWGGDVVVYGLAGRWMRPFAAVLPLFAPDSPSCA
jgi:hypothetical protein